MRVLINGYISAAAAAELDTFLCDILTMELWFILKYILLFPCVLIKRIKMQRIFTEGNTGCGVVRKVDRNLLCFFITLNEKQKTG